MKHCRQHKSNRPDPIKYMMFGPATCLGHMIADFQLYYQANHRRDDGH